MESSQIERGISRKLNRKKTQTETPPKQTTLEAALEYQERGFSVIPLKPDKRPYIKWRDYQDKKASKEQITNWFGMFVDAMIGIVTGRISGITVLDADSEEGRRAAEGLLSQKVPIVKTPNGYHYYFDYIPGVSNKAGIGLPDCDTRNDGGYVAAPPSKSESGVYYKWIISLDEAPPPKPPSLLESVLLEEIQLPTKDNKQSDQPHQAIDTISNGFQISFDQGARDQSLFHTALMLLRGGMSFENATRVLFKIGGGCSPPFPENEILNKLKSAHQRCKGKDKKALIELVREVIEITDGAFSTGQVQSLVLDQHAQAEDRRKVSKILHRLCKSGELEKVGNQNGTYRRPTPDSEKIDFLNADTEPANIILPFKLHQKVDILPGNIILVAGTPNSGKTSILLNIARWNMNKYNVYYFSSEMGDVELRKRLSKFDKIALEDWTKVEFLERSVNFPDVIRPGEGNINIIDYIEIHDEFFKISEILAKIHQYLHGGIAIVGLQKNPNTDTGIGGYRSLEKPRLALSIDPGRLKVVKAKNWKEGQDNPNGLTCDFKIIGGARLEMDGEWRKEDVK